MWVDGVYGPGVVRESGEFGQADGDIRQLCPSYVHTVRINVENSMDHRYRVDTEKLKKAREEAGLTVAGLAVKTGVDAYHLALVEGQSYVPTLTTLRDITLALGLPAHTVIEWKPARFAWEGSERPA